MNISDKTPAFPTTSSQPIQQSSLGTTTSPTVNSTNAVVSKISPPSHPVVPTTVASALPITPATTKIVVSKPLQAEQFKKYVNEYHKQIIAIENFSLLSLLPTFNEEQKETFRNTLQYKIGGSSPIRGHCDVTRNFQLYLLSVRNEKLPLTQALSVYIKQQQKVLEDDLAMGQANDRHKEVKELELKYLQFLVEKMPKDTIVNLRSINELFENHKQYINSLLNQYVHNILEIQNSFQPAIAPIVTEPSEEVTPSSNISIIEITDDRDEVPNLPFVTEPKPDLTNTQISKNPDIEVTDGPINEIIQLLFATPFKTVEQWEADFTDIVSKIADRAEAKSLINTLLEKIDSAQIPQSIKSDMQSLLQWLNDQCAEQGEQCLNLQTIKFSLLYILNKALKGAVHEEIATISNNIYNLINPPECKRFDIVMYSFGKKFSSETVDEFFSKVQDHKARILEIGTRIRALKDQITYKDVYSAKIELHLLLTQIMKQASATKAPEIGTNATE